MPYSLPKETLPACALRVVMAQLNLIVGDVSSNQQSIINAAIHARDALNADAIVFPELTLTSYPPEDLLLRNDFIGCVDDALEQIKQQVSGITLIIGHPQQKDGALYNAASVIQEGELISQYFKQQLPNRSVFDEHRYFTSGEHAALFTLKNVTFGLTICEDVWQAGPVQQTIAAGAEVILSLNASPFHLSKSNERYLSIRDNLLGTDVPLLYVNLLGGQDELVFDGGSFVLNKQAEICQIGVQFEEQLIAVDFDEQGELVQHRAIELKDESIESRLYKALVMGVKDYLGKNGVTKALLGLSGGIDSALTLAIAADALGSENVSAVMMPTRYTSDISLSEAARQAEIMGVEYHTLPIESVFNEFLTLLDPVFDGAPVDVTEENIQARCRGVILMALSNKQGRMLLTTGNKSEMSVGYATLYGDMAGGFAPIKDVAKIMVFRLASYRNTLSPIIPQIVIDRPPSAELRDDQKDEDSLPPYDILDGILAAYVENDHSIADIVDMGYEPAVVQRVVQLVDRNEHKRRQAPPGIRITSRAFGKDRRYPITSGFSKQ